MKKCLDFNIPKKSTLPGKFAEKSSALDIYLGERSPKTVCQPGAKFIRSPSRAKKSRHSAEWISAAEHAKSSLMNRPWLFLFRAGVGRNFSGIIPQVAAHNWRRAPFSVCRRRRLSTVGLGGGEHKERQISAHFGAQGKLGAAGNEAKPAAI